jgi:chemotaxis response regulator CheB
MDRPASKRPAHRYVAVGASGGEGLDDLRELLAALPHPVAGRS